ncbi:MAG: tetratricopeptide repeat protein [Gemmatimonadetes bacterium]|uniref:Tetratricopeptide repeat protein n=1 Tax=Candidatus Kutchimonas denitrificans TaxID=3056748 RepID=A0AAE5CAV3_9BACT|nr:tetratricopeptide repeat protein [Gemmatimonadota bacterium]NIR73725.1 tetratricopeptide repeat protein [Candidatus Kutchimonas denitrificans]NIS02465.1 tetratricopeptide repeat protein [Gemmatimonadota bacterium]NIT67455.1 tetratricopeptide repeat protein [Gemmatimonadota bacterium]NIU51587.1 tetratricopeptide repeat protein [Gemmatimonadota bacterium]
MRDLKRLVGEIHRRSLWQVLGIYLVGAWVAYEVIQSLTEGLALPGWLPGFAVVLFIIGLPIVLATAFVQHGLPGGAADPTLLPGRDEVAGERQVGPGLRRLLTWRNAITGGVAAFALWGVIAAGWVVLGRSLTGGAGPVEAAAPDKSVAVLPFESLSADEENLYFARGVHEDILTYLSRVRDLRVISRSSVMGYAGQPINLVDVARELGVAHIVEGSVRREGNRVRVSAQLIDARTDEHLWADNFDRDLADVFAIQTAIAQEIVAALEANLTPDEERRLAKQPTDDIDAYDLYVRARETISGSGLALSKDEAAEELLEQAVAIDPEFARAWALLAKVRGDVYWFAADRSPERLAAIKAATDRAFALEPDLPEARLALGTYYYRGFYDYERALEQLELAHDALPNSADVLYFMGLTLRRLGRWDESVAAFEEATLLDPGNVGTRAELINTARDARDYEMAWEASDRAYGRDPDNSVFAAHRAMLYLYHKGAVDSARATLARVAPVDEQFYARARWLAALWGRDYDGALEVLEQYGHQFDWLTPGAADWLAGETLVAAGAEARARDRLSRARATLEAETQKPYADNYVWPHVVLGRVYGWLGEGEKALESCRRAASILPESKDKVHGVGASSWCALTRALVGERDAALAEIERLLQTPAGFTRAELALEPTWDFFRDDPRFQALIRSVE